MDTFELNKFFGAFLGSLLVIFVINEIGNELVHPEEHVKTAIAISMPEGAEGGGKAETAAAEKSEPETPLAVLLAAADPARGAKEAKKCKACHNLEKGAGNKVGPHLYGVLGRKKGSVPDFGYSPAMKEKGGTWTYEDLNHFLTSPKDFVPGTKMSFAGLKKAKDRADLLLYLRQQNDSPPPLPKP